MQRVDGVEGVQGAHRTWREVWPAGTSGSRGLIRIRVPPGWVDEVLAHDPDRRDGQAGAHSTMTTCA